jgi:hypothetical protein
MLEAGKETAKIKIGEMSKPHYLVEASNTSIDSDGSDIKWIGIEAYSPNGEVRKFLWWRNFKIGSLNRTKARHYTAAFIARLKLEMGADATIGLPVDLSASNSQTGHVQIPSEKGVYGIYVEAEKRQMFNFMAMLQGVKSEEELRRNNPTEFEEIFQKALAVLPKS